MFKRLAEAAGRSHRVTIDGKAVEARAGDTVAAAMLAAGIEHCRTTPVTGAPRAPYCLMGVCFDCLVTSTASAAGRAAWFRCARACASRHSTGGGPADDAAGPAPRRTAVRPRRDRRRAGRACRGSDRGRAAGLSTVLFDENPAPGGQIYRGITATPVTQPRASWARTTGPARSLVAEAKASGAAIVNGATVWSLDPHASSASRRARRSAPDRRPGASSSRPARWSGRFRFPAGRCPA